MREFQYFAESFFHDTRQNTRGGEGGVGPGHAEERAGRDKVATWGWGGGVTSRKLGFGHRAIFTLDPVQSRTGTNVSIGPGSCGQGPAGPRGGIGPGSSGPFGPGWWDKPGPMGHAPGPPPFSPGSYHKPGLKGWS